MSEKVGVSTKDQETKKEFSLSQKQNTDFSQPEHSPLDIDQTLHWQRDLGNQAVQRFMEWRAIQAKLKISQPDDKYEQEADRVADQVMRMPEPRESLVNGHGSLGKREKESSLVNGHSSLVQRQSTCPECMEEVRLQRKEMAGRTSDVAPGVESHIQNLKTGGHPLSRSTRTFFEPRFGADFSHVRVHSGSRAAQAAQSVDAHAFTTGNNIVFNQNKYLPGTSGGKRLLAHELAHVIQQGKDGAGKPFETLQCEAGTSCPQREANEVANSRSPGGILPHNTYMTTSNNELVIHDFGVNRADLPPNVTNSEPWQRAMSYIIGDPSMRVGIEGFADCQGDAQYNLDLRQRRADTVVAAMPPQASSRILFNFSINPGHYLDTNATVEGRARNRAVRLSFQSLHPQSQDPCDAITQAANMDEYLFLIRCVENRLNLTRPADATTVLSLVRQIYYGNTGWSSSRSVVWNFVIPQRPWSPGTDPRPQLRIPLFNALRNSQVVEGRDVGHLFTGLDAMLHPQNVELTRGIFTYVTSLPNEEWATWAGDVGSAVANFTIDSYYQTMRYSGARDYFDFYANPEDLYGNIDAFALRAAANPGGTPSSKLMTAWNPNGPLSEILLQYYRLTSTPLGSSFSDRVQNFVEAYGGIVSNRQITNRPALEARLLPSIEEFAGYFMLQEILQRGNPPQGAPNPDPIRTQALTDMTRWYVDWLQANL
jgi:outer membrane protein OmpA-like peptidoglycan-associated protein